MVMMNDDLWSKIMDSVYGLDDVLTQRIDNEVQNVSNADVQCAIESLVDEKDELEDQIAKTGMRETQALRSYIKSISNVWSALNKCREE